MGRRTIKEKARRRSSICFLTWTIQLLRGRPKEISKLCVMLLTIIVFYSFIVRCLKRENKLIAISEPTSTSVTSHSITSTSASSSATNSIAYNHLSKGLLKDAPLNNRDKDERVPADKREKDNPNDSSKEPYSDDEVADDNQFDEEEFYNIIATKAAAFQSKRNSSTSTASSSIYDDTYRTKRNSLRSQSSTCSEIMETSTTGISIGNRRSSEDRAQNRKLNYKTRRHGFQTLSKRRRTTGRYFFSFSPPPVPSTSLTWKHEFTFIQKKSWIFNYQSSSFIVSNLSCPRGTNCLCLYRLAFSRWSTGV